MDVRTDLLQGTLDLLILQVLTLGPRHGWGISQRIQQRSGDVLHVNQGSLYPALHRLERRGLVSATWSVSDNGRRARYYQLTSKGRKALEREAAQWQLVSGAIQRILHNA